ncbi:MAG: hypothetical protein ACLQUZ_01575 [Rhizomicrobium sp.]
MTESKRVATLQYLMSMLAQIAATLRDFGYQDEAVALDNVRFEMEKKIPAIKVQD